MKRKYVYFVSHFKEYGEDIEQRKTLGIFSSRQKAKAALEKYKHLPGFKNDTREEIFIARKKLGLSFWDGGFSTVAEIMSAYGTIIYEEEEEEFTETVIDLPYWFKNQEDIKNNETHIQAIIQERHLTKDYPHGPQSELFQIKKYLSLTPRLIDHAHIQSLPCKS